MSKRKLSPHRPSGRRPKHGAYAIIYRDEILKQYPELARYTLDCRDGLVKDLAPGGLDTLSMAKQIILDRLISKLLAVGVLDIFLGKNGVIRRDRLDQRVLEAEPIVATWLSVNNAILRDLEALGLERKALEATPMTIEEVTAAVHAEREAKEEAVSAVERAQGDIQGKTTADRTNDTGGIPDGTGGDE